MPYKTRITIHILCFFYTILSSNTMVQIPNSPGNALKPQSNRFPSPFLLQPFRHLDRHIKTASCLTTYTSTPSPPPQTIKEDFIGHFVKS